MVKDYYRLLGLPRGAPMAEIKSAYRRMAAQYHPDKVSGLGPEVQEVAQAKMLELNEAMAVLADPVRRAEYDEVLDLIPERPVSGAAARATPPTPASAEPAEEDTAPSERPAEGEPGSAATPKAVASPPRAASAPAPSVSRDLFLEQQGRELKTGLQGLAMHWRESTVRGWQWILESGDWRRTVVVAHRHIESLSLLSVRGFLSSFEALVGERKLTTKGTTIVGVVTYENLMDATTVREQVQSVVGGTRGLFKTVTPIIVLHDARSRRTILFGSPTDYPDTKRVVRFLLSPRGA